MAIALLRLEDLAGVGLADDARIGGGAHDCPSLLHEVPYLLGRSLAEDPARVAIGALPRQRSVEAHGVLKVREAERAEAPCASLMAFIVAMAPALLVAGVLRLVSIAASSHRISFLRLRETVGML